MVKKYVINAVIVTTLFIVSALEAQDKRIEKADQKYEGRAYIDAAKVYERVARSGYKSEELLKKLGNTYYFNAKYQQSSKWYGELIAMGDVDEPIYYLRYSQSIRALGEDEKAEKYYNIFLEKTGPQNNFTDAKSYLNIIEQNSGRYDMSPFEFNSEAIEFGGFVKDDVFYFTSSARKKGTRKIIDGWSNQYFLDVFTVNYDSVNQSYNKVKRGKQKLNTKEHDASMTITKDGKTLYITRSNSSPNSLDVDPDTGKLKIYRATLNEKGEWTNFEDLIINSDSYSTAHPVLGPEEKTLYFVSNRPGGYGETDIYMSFIKENGALSEPINLGTGVNTKGRESFPFVTQNNELYFSSDGHYGLGGYDVFYVDLKDKLYRMINVGKPINSSYDDFAFSINSQGKGFVSSNRPEGQGQDDIYLFTETIPIKDAINTSVNGVVLGDQTGQPIEGVEITVRDIKGNLINSVVTNAKGEYKIEINKFYDNTIIVTKQDYEGQDLVIPSNPNGKDIIQDIKLTSTKIEVVDNTDIREQLNMPPIYFDFNESTIKEAAALELEKIVALLKEYPTIKIEVRSHTDSRGEDDYNLRLSERRAKATVAYIISRGVSADRITGKGFGKSILINECDTRNKCSDEEHAKNRRSEFIIKQ